MRAAAAALVAALTVTGCGSGNATFEELSQARHGASDLQADFIRAVDAANRAVMADSDAASVSAAQDANAARQSVRAHVGALRPLLERLGFSDEVRLIGAFEGHFAAYEAVDRQILDLAVENTNLKAQRLSFGSGQAAADAFRGALESLSAAQPHDAWRLKAAVSGAVAAVRDIQVLQAPHIAEPEDASMAAIEARMKADEAAAREALAALPALIASGSRPKLLAATTALQGFIDVNTQVVALSRRNTNVRSLALALKQKPQLVPPCEQDLRALREALAQRGHRQGRWGS